MHVAPLSVAPIDDPAAIAAEWDAFVLATPGGALGHAAAWHRVFADAYGLRTSHLIARDANGELAGILPLFRIRTLTGRSELVSLPFLDTGGILARTPAAESALLDAALERVRASGARALELRQLEPLRGQAADASCPRVDLALRLESNEDAQWKAVGAKVRNQTRKAEREGLQVSAGRTPEYIDGFYGPFVENMRDLGSPVHPRAMFVAAAAAFGEDLRFSVVKDGDRSIGGLVAIRFGDVVTVPWASTLRAERRRCPNNLIYWDAMRWAIAEAALEFDFGRSPRDSGTHRFKRGWGAEERPLCWRRFDRSGAALSVEGASDNTWLSRFSELWTRLPLGLTARLGPALRRHIAS